MSRVIFGKETTVEVNIIGLTIHPTRQRTLTLGLSNKNETYQCLINLTQFNLDSIAHCLKNRPDPCPKYLCFDMTPDLCSDKEEADRVGFDSKDQELLAGILEHAPSLLKENWITYEDALKLVDFQLDWIKKYTTEID